MKRKKFPQLTIITLLVMISLSFSHHFVSSAGSGDVNNDGKVDIIDALKVAQYYVGLNPTDFMYENADINSDGYVDILDALFIAQIYVGIVKQGAEILIPHESWTCGMEDGIPKPEKGELILELDLVLDHIYNVGRTQYGERQVIVIQGGTITGPGINGSVMPGGLDFQLDLSNNAMEIEQILVLRTDDGRYIYLRSAGTAAHPDDVRIVPDFEAPNSSSYNWLNNGTYAGRRVINPADKTMTMTIYDISAVMINPDSTNTVTVTEPDDVPDQPWNFRVADPSEKQGPQFITETVTLGESQSVGESKRGNRNIIPITGGTVTGTITGTILSAGADYQNLSNPMTIDARYLWETNDGELIIVRNGGQFGSLVPTFEVREASRYSYLINNLYLSSDPGVGSGSVTITFYESTR
jgi:hypothetical protein